MSDIGFMLVATDHRHYVDQTSYSDVTSDFDFRHRSQYLSGNTLTYKTGGYGQPVTLTGSYDSRDNHLPAFRRRLSRKQGARPGPDRSQRRRGG